MAIIALLAPLGAVRAAGGQGHLLVADPTESVVYVYSLDDLSLTGQLDDTKLGAHNGVLTMTDGRVLFTDDAAGNLKIVSIDSAGVPTVDAQVPLWQGSRIVWGSVDESGRYVVLASQLLESPDLQVLNIVDLQTLSNTAVQLPMGADEEIIGWLAADGQTVAVSLGGSVATYAMADLLDSGDVTPLGEVAIELGSHGAVADPDHGRFLITTAAGFEVTDVSAGAPSHVTTVPWDVDGLAGGQNYRPRLAPDGRHVLGVLTAPPATPEEWATARVSAHIVDLDTLEASRVELGIGRFAGRWGISARYALFAGTDGATGAAHLFDIDPASPTYGTVVRSVPLDQPTNGAVPGSPTTGTEGYLTTITADGSTGFVVHGGDGRISVIDTATGVVTESIETPTKLTATGYAAVVGAGAEVVDQFFR